jgi:CMP-N-acetylneuraminic acid synthetase
MEDKKKPSVYGFIFARGGSKGVPGKNIRDFNGKPLLAWTVELAASLNIFDRIIVSTDSPDIAEVARQYGAETPFMRPLEFATDSAPERLAWRHAVENLPPFDIMVNLPATAPLRKPETVMRCVELIQKGDTDMVITVTPAVRHPSFNMVTLDADGYAHLLMPAAGHAVLRRQDAPSAYDMTTVCYATTPSVVLSLDRIMSGRVKPVIVGQEEAMDIDSLVDFDVAAFLHSRRIHGDFN